ncbi:MAG: SHOCT domain-containing protein [Proteobacteria bacterium]|nr:SHOCT domain-containing protein [Pseudomonadota bacterium]
MEKIIFFVLVIPILIFVFYMGGSAIMTGFKAKMQNKNEEEIVEENEIKNNSSVSDELTKLNELKNKGILTQEEFEKAKAKLLR